MSNRPIKKIGIICDQCIDQHFPPHFHEVYTNLLQQRGYKTVVAAFYKDIHHPAVARMIQKGLYLLPKTGGRMTHRLKLIAQVNALFKNPAFQDVDAWIIHNDPLLLLLIQRQAKRRNQYVLYRPTHLMPEEFLESDNTSKQLIGRTAQKLRNNLLPQCDMILPISTTAAEILKNQVTGISDKLLPLYSTADPFECTKKSEKYIHFQHDKILCYIGTLNQSRELSILIDIMFIILKQRDDVGLLMLGIEHNKQDVAKLESYAIERGIQDHLIWHQPVSETALPDILNQVDIGLSPIPPNTVMRANAPLKTLDYINCGVPVVASRIPAHIDMFSQCNAGLAVDHRAEDFARGLLTLLDETAEQRHHRIQSGQDWIKRNRSLNSACDVLEQAFARCIFPNAERTEWQKSA